MKLIKMQKGELVADVHPDEVENFIKGGYVKVKPKPRKKAVTNGSND